MILLRDEVTVDVVVDLVMRDVTASRSNHPIQDCNTKTDKEQSSSSDLLLIALAMLLHSCLTEFCMYDTAIRKNHAGRATIKPLTEQAL
jgi:hypothetical protein